MAQRQIASMATGALTDGSQEAFSLQTKHFRRNIQPVISIKGIAGVETVSLWKYSLGDWEEVPDSSGTQVSFTATAAAYIIAGPGTYGFTKSSTAGALVVALDDGV